MSELDLDAIRKKYEDGERFKDIGGLLAAANYIPALVAEVERLREELEADRRLHAESVWGTAGKVAALKLEIKQLREKNEGLKEKLLYALSHSRPADD